MIWQYAVAAEGWVIPAELPCTREASFEEPNSCIELATQMPKPVLRRLSVVIKGLYRCCIFPRITARLL